LKNGIYRLRVWPLSVIYVSDLCGKLI
jgi:hypothetical protein